MPSEGITVIRCIRKGWTCGKWIGAESVLLFHCVQCCGTFVPGYLCVLMYCILVCLVVFTYVCTSIVCIVCIPMYAV